jgi:hypothetical protein
MDEQQQRSFFHVIFNLQQVVSITIGREGTGELADSPAITINTSALLTTLYLYGWRGVMTLTVNNFALTCQSDVQALSNIILAKCNAKCKILPSLHLKSIKCPVKDFNKEDSDESDRFLDPLFYAASGMGHFWVSTKTHSAHSTLVSPTALRALFIEGKPFRTLILNDLGLTDSHVRAIVDGLSTPSTHLRRLNLESNPGITAQGYGALLSLINRANVVGYANYSEWIGFCLDDKAWEGELNLVSEMNSKYGRLEHLTNGTFTSEERKFQWLERVAGLPRNKNGPGPPKKSMDAKHLTFIWYTLRQNPEMMQVSQAPTRTISTEKRKPT